jgi:uncharacterized membrane protein YoaK (UPF0700 family)
MKDSLSKIHTFRFVPLLPTVLSLTAGSADVTSFLGLGLFSAHVTGNLVLLTAHIVARRTDNACCLILSVPIFILVLGLTRLLVAGFEVLDVSSLRPLLLLQFLMLSGSFAVGLASDHRSPEARSIVLAGQLSVAAMAIQNALGQLSLRGVPSTAVMTTNLVAFVVDAGEVLLGRDSVKVAVARRRAIGTWHVLVGFIAGAGIGAAGFAAAGLKSLILPAVLALFALLMSSGASPARHKA